MNNEPDWARRIREEWDLPPEAEAILEEAIKAYHRLREVEKALEGQPLLIPGRAGSRVANPLLALERATRAAFISALRALNLPEE